MAALEKPKIVYVGLIKFLLTVLAFYVISKRINLAHSFTINKTNLDYLPVIIFLAISLVIMQAYRWKNILAMFAVPARFGNCLIAVWFGHLINNIMPTGTAGDLVRTYSLRYSADGNSKWQWIMAFITEKYSAATSALLLVPLSMLTSIHDQLPKVIMVFICLLLLALLTAPIIMQLILSLHLPQIQKLTPHLNKMTKCLTNLYLKLNGQQAFLLSVAINLGMCGVFYFIAVAEDVHVTFIQCLFVVPVFTFLAALPISFAGWGVRELSCVELLHFFGISPRNAFAVSVIYGLVILISALPGILVAYPFVSSFYSSSRNAQQA